MPERVYVVDSRGPDSVVSLRVTPVSAATYFPASSWFADRPELTGVEVTTVVDALPFEKIAAASQI